MERRLVGDEVAPCEQRHERETRRADRLGAPFEPVDERHHADHLGAGALSFSTAFSVEPPVVIDVFEDDHAEPGAEGAVALDEALREP